MAVLFKSPPNIVPDGSDFPINLYVPKNLSETKREGRGGGRLNGSDRGSSPRESPAHGAFSLFLLL